MRSQTISLCLQLANRKKNNNKETDLMTMTCC